MLRLSSYTEYYNTLSDYNTFNTYSSRTGQIGNRMIDGFYSQTYPSGTAPTVYNSITPRTMTKNDVGAIPLPLISNGGFLNILGYQNSTTAISNVHIVFDRLVEVGAISANSTSLQTFSTGTLPRYQNDKNIVCIVEPGTNLAAGTEQRATLTYTNQDGVSGRTGFCSIGGGDFGTTHSARFLKLQAGDSGVRSVESLQLDGTILATANRINIVLAKCHGMFVSSGVLMNNTSAFANLINGNMVGGLTNIHSDACLFFVRAIFNVTGFNDGTIMGNVIIKENYEI